MFKCFLTGIELNKESAYVLDIPKVLNIIRNLKNKHDALSNLVNQLGSFDNVEIVGKKGKLIRQRRKRLICRQLANEIGNTLSDNNIFITWKEWLERTSNKNKR